MWPDLQETMDLVTLTEENLNGKLHLLYSESYCFSLFTVFHYHLAFDETTLQLDHIVKHRKVVSKVFLGQNELIIS